MYELKSIINYDLEISRFESDAAFWKFVGNPFYRMQEKSIVEDCRAIEEYKKKAKTTLQKRKLRILQKYYREVTVMEKSMKEMLLNFKDAIGEENGKE